MQGLLVGTDDYMVKPVNQEELLLRIKALLRRAQIASERKLHIGKVTLDYDALTVTRDGCAQTLPKKEFYLLFKLLSYPDKIFTRLQLMDEIWGWSLPQWTQQSTPISTGSETSLGTGRSLRSWRSGESVIRRSSAMGKLKRFSCKQQLTIMFAAMVFLFMFFAMLIVFLGAFLLYRLGLVHGNRSVGVILVLFAVISLLVGAALSMVFSRFPLAPLRDLMNAIDRIADGDYSARINLKAPAELKKLSEKFNHMAEEIGSVEMLRSDFINNFSHEFKTPISSIQGFAEMLKLDDLTQEERENIFRQSSRKLPALRR